MMFQIAVLQQDLLEKDVEEARKKRTKKQNISDPSMAGTQRRGEGRMDITPD